MSATPTHRAAPASPPWGAIEAAICLAVAAGWLAWTWMKWFDPTVDFGRELYIAWRLAEGDVLYRDHAFFDGPLAPYLNSLWFRIGGSSITTLVLANILLAAGLTLLLRHLIRRVAGALAGAIATLLFITVFAASHLLDTGNYNFIAPYSHPITHGILLSAAALAVLGAALHDGRHRWLAAAGLLNGLVFLTKADLFLALSGALAIGVLAAAHARRERPAAVARRLALLAITTLAAPAAAFALLATAMPAREALLGTLGTWPAVVQGRASNLRLYRDIMGTLDLGFSLRVLAIASLLWAGFFGAVILAARRLDPAHPRRALLVLGAGALAFTVLSLVPWRDILRPLPLATLLLLLWSLTALHRGRDDASADHAPLALRVALLAWALLLMTKMILNVRFRHYGFALPMPAVLLLVAACVAWIPAALDRRGGTGGLARACGIALAAAIALSQFLVTAHWMGAKTLRIGSGRDAFLAMPRTAPLVEALSWLATNTPPDATLATIPEGAMANFLLRRRNPTIHSTAVPTEMVIYGEDDFIRRHEAAPPDYILLINKDTSEFGFRFFARDYAGDFGRWIADNYRPVALFGQPPFTGTEFGIRVVRHDPGWRTREPAAAVP